MTSHPGRPAADASPTEPTAGTILGHAEALLSKRFGGTQTFIDVQALGGAGVSYVFRARLAPNSFLHDRSVIVKYIPITDDALDGAALVREVVSYQFTTSLPEKNRPGPILLAYDVPGRIIIISDSGDGDTFAELLASRDADRRIGILDNLGRSIGLMHVGTADREADFETLRALMARRYPRAAAINQMRSQTLCHGVRLGATLLEETGIRLPRDVRATADEAYRRIRAGHRAFSPNDLAPDNIIVADRTQFLDYEWAGFRESAYDVAAVIAGFPEFLSLRPISDDEADIFVEAWVSEVSEIWPRLRDERHLHGVLVAALYEVASMHLGSSHNLVHATSPEAAEFGIERIDEHITPIEALLAPVGSTPVPGDDVRLLRRDLFETFEALARFAGRLDDPRFGVVGGFAGDMAARLKDGGTAWPQRGE